MQLIDVRPLLALALAIALTAPASATMLVRQGLDDLTKSNHTVLVGEVIDVYSYWNEGGTFVLTDVIVAPSEVLKGRVGDEVVITVMGGTIGDQTTLIVGGAELLPGASYVLFVDNADLPGAPGAFTVKEHSQGVFEIVDTGSGLRAVSQAVDQRLVPDASGDAKVAGDFQGFPLDAMLENINRTIHAANGENK